MIYQVYDNGKSVENIYIEHNYGSSRTLLNADRITMCTSNFCNIYTDAIDLILYNSIVIRRNLFNNKGRASLCTNSANVNNEDLGNYFHGFKLKVTSMSLI